MKQSERDGSSIKKKELYSTLATHEPVYIDNKSCMQSNITHM